MPDPTQTSKPPLSRRDFLLVLPGVVLFLLMGITGALDGCVGRMGYELIPGAKAASEVLSYAALAVGLVAFALGIAVAIVAVLNRNWPRVAIALAAPLTGAAAGGTTGFLGWVVMHTLTGIFDPRSFP